MSRRQSSPRIARIEELLLGNASRALNPDERRELNDILRHDAAARSHAARWLADDSALADHLRESSLEALFDGEAVGLAALRYPSPERARPPMWRRPGWLPLAVAAAVTIVAGVWWTVADRTEKVVARFGTMNDCRWVRATDQSKPGDAVKKGQRIELSAGRAEIVFECGAVTTMQGPCILEVESASGAFLMLGEASTRADGPAAKGFVMRTRLSRIVDLGTEFVTSVGADGHNSVEVTAGEVVVHPEGAEIPQHLRLGDQLLIEPGNGRVMVRVERGDESPEFRFPTIPPPTDADYADARNGHARITLGQGTLRPLSSQWGASGPVERLIDGRGQSGEDMPAESVFFEDNTDGNLVLDLGRQVVVEKINSYSWHQNSHFIDNRFRAQQRYRLYGSAGESPPSVEGDPVAAGWTFIARVNTDEYFGVRHALDRPSQQACSILSQSGSLGSFRFLLWAVEPVQVPDKKFLNHTFYGEFDVFARP